MLCRQVKRVEVVYPTEENAAGILSSSLEAFAVDYRTVREGLSHSM